MTLFITQSSLNHFLFKRLWIIFDTTKSFNLVFFTFLSHQTNQTIDRSKLCKIMRMSCQDTFTTRSGIPLEYREYFIVVKFRPDFRVIKVNGIWIDILTETLFKCQILINQTIFLQQIKTRGLNIERGQQKEVVLVTSSLFHRMEIQGGAHIAVRRTHKRTMIS